MKIVTITRDNDFVIVVPTRSVESELAKGFLKAVEETSCLNPSIIMIESSGPEFHFSKVMNIGISEAFKMSPSAIALSNDDVRPLTKCWDRIMIEKVRKDNLAYISPIFVNDKGRIVGPIVVMPSYLKVELFTTFYGVIPSQLFPFIRWLHKVTTRARVEYNSSSLNSFSGIVNTQPFSIFNSSSLKDIGGFDERFVNGVEDFDLALNTFSHGMKIGLDTSVKFLDIGSATIGKGGFSILYRPNKADKQKVENWRFLIKKYGRKKYNNYIESFFSKVIVYR